MGISLLSKEYTKEVRREKILRSAVVIFGIINTVLLVGIIFMLPSYFTLTLSQEEVARRLQAQQESFARQNVNVIEEKIQKINALAALHQKNENNRRRVAPLLLGLASSDIPGVELRTARLSEDESGSFVVLLQGRAATRNAFLTYEKSIENIDGIAAVHSPVSNLLHEADVLFELEAVLNKEFYSYVKNP
ncbi:hypothetical protein A3J56_00605 [Candidatus Giovannonibacteria bacterium RIFCSPHIGHO2_02_FULL_46_20]|uniref:Uncharacterized protein n=1 Tax=Candidatus Giovannonibacteria bacterium RIFCSPHIGHO2_02_FULL_46_20 TaxID=1798338 RepID=A0A1F5WDB7_9BACT|nr:MAG: hypothetical protein A3J56_00605 [Candidatus Giovannonibacteria bacterium RIFCSPHIGHO2_02_FULL_46_20]